MYRGFHANKRVTHFRVGKSKAARRVRTFVLSASAVWGELPCGFFSSLERRCAEILRDRLGANGFCWIIAGTCVGMFMGLWSFLKIRSSVGWLCHEACQLKLVIRCIDETSNSSIVDSAVVLLHTIVVRVKFNWFGKMCNYNLVTWSWWCLIGNKTHYWSHWPVCLVWTY